MLDFSKDVAFKVILARCDELEGEYVDAYFQLNDMLKSRSEAVEKGDYSVFKASDSDVFRECFDTAKDSLFSEYRKFFYYIKGCLIGQEKAD